ncbi:lysophospholipid acyltransferase family protein [Halarcobacter sp.]|uniref:lysophospholipid acyltransferase family protein n=1 Tax=Halarcobacter sp. TaxID=2321133 RepID=UPI0029F5CAB2|nr:lysophospholipid acyltransferase family protein [Halarcobacter sp.]
MKLFLITRVVPFILQLFVRFIYLTSKKVFHHPKIDLNEPFIVTFWHGELLMQPFNYKKIKPKGKVSAMISEHKDGEAITRTVEYLGIDSIRGSSTRGGAKALIGAIKELKAGDDIAITPDGPRGPRHSVADGIVAISQKTNARILIFNCKPTKYWQFNSWDKFIVPKPFGKLEFFIQEPFDVNSLDNNEAKELIKKKLLLNSME